MKHGVKHILTLVLLSMVIALQAQIISVQSKLSADSMMIGDRLIFTIRTEAADEVSFRMPLISDTLSSDIEVLAPFTSDTTRNGEGRLVIEHSYFITGFEEGLQVVPSQEVIYTFNATSDTAKSMPLMLRVYSPAVDTSQQIKPIKPPLNAPLTLKEILPWAGLGVVVWLTGTLIFALIWMHRQKRRDPEIFSIKPQEPAHIVAFRDLDNLKEKKLWESGQAKRFYTRLTEISRHYIERQYGIPAMERTTEEILEAFRKSNTEDPLLDDMLKELLELADLVKFAKEDPLPLDNQSNLNNAYLFVQKTYRMFFVEKDEEIKEEGSHE